MREFPHALDAQCELMEWRDEALLDRLLDHGCLMAQELADFAAAAEEAGSPLPRVQILAEEWERLIDAAVTPPVFAAFYAQEEVAYG